MSDKKQPNLRLSQAILAYVAVKAESLQWNGAGKVLQRISMVREKVKNEVGVHPDSVKELRSLREGDR